MFANIKIKKGFTLIELLIAITIIGILSATLVPRIVNILPTARDGARKASLNDMIAAVEAYNLDEGTYPDASFCLIDNDAAPDGFLQTYLRNNPPLFKEAGSSDCATSVLYTVGGDADEFEYAVSVAVETEKAANSTAADSIEEVPEGYEGDLFYVIAR